jgi:hypothetical protein
VVTVPEFKTPVRNPQLASASDHYKRCIIVGRSNADAMEFPRGSAAIQTV